MGRYGIFNTGVTNHRNGPYAKKLNLIAVRCCPVLIRPGQLSSVVVEMLTDHNEASATFDLSPIKLTQYPKSR